MSSRPYPAHPSREAAQAAYGTGSRLRGQSADARTDALLLPADLTPRVIRPGAARMPMADRLANYSLAGWPARKRTGRQRRRARHKAGAALDRARRDSAAGRLDRLSADEIDVLRLARP
jgi:hypothetical protein